MEKTIKVKHETYAKLLEKKSQVVAEQGKNISFSDLIGRLLNVKN